MSAAKPRDDTGLPPNDFRGRQVLRLLRELGPMTPTEVAAEAQCREDTIRKALCRLCYTYGLLHVPEWRHEPRANGNGTWPHPVYAAGPGRNKRRPRPKRPAQIQSERQARYQAQLSVTRPGIGRKAAQALFAAARRRAQPGSPPLSLNKSTSAVIEPGSPTHVLRLLHAAGGPATVKALADTARTKRDVVERSMHTLIDNGLAEKAGMLDRQLSYRCTAAGTRHAKHAVGGSLV